MNTQEQNYLDLVKKVFVFGNEKNDRTEVGTLSIFGEQLKFSLKDQFPLLTCKKVFFRGVFEELMWFIKGDTNVNHLNEKGVKIWNEFGKKQNLEKLGLPHKDGDIGPCYGFQWRHFGSQYHGSNYDYNGCGIDQLQNVIDNIKSNPDSRRLFVSAWNPLEINNMALPPCHVSYQFYIHNNQISCHMYQRSCDVLLGLPFNIASYALLTHMLAQVCGLRVGELIISTGDTHIYQDHVNQVNTQLSRTEYPLPTLWLNPNVVDIDKFTMEDIKLQNYQSHDTIKANMAV